MQSLQHLALYPHQREGVEFLVRRQRAILGDDMGLGKTRQAITALLSGAPEGVFLVICPASLKLNWAREIRQVDPEARIEVLGAAGPAETKPQWVIVNYDLLSRNSGRLGQIPWTGVVVDEAHFIKNTSQRASHVLKLLGVAAAGASDHVPRFVFLLTGTPMPNRPRDLFNLLRAVGHPSARSFISFTRRYCGGYRNDYGWVATGASNLDDLNLLLKEVMLRRRKDEVLDLPPKVRSWLPVQIDTASAFTAQQRFLEWYQASDPSRPNDTEFLARITKLRLALHKAKHAACAERIRDVVDSGQKVLVFTTYSEGLLRHRKTLGETAVTISGADCAEQRLAAMDRFQEDPDVRVAVCNLLAGGVGLNLTAATHVIFQDLDWVPANHLQAEDRCYRIGQRQAVTVEYLLAEGTLDRYIARLLEAKLRLIQAVEADLAPEASVLRDLQDELVRLAPSLMEEARATALDGADSARLEALSGVVASLPESAPLLETGAWEFPSARDPSKSYAVTFGRSGHLECSCPGFGYRGDCKHVITVRQQTLAG
jgi:SWI/SNF-related matrix-associated actin-dependent regulator 1 of chromatin subfamily A